ncbi:hypothetical protein AGOR_G00207600 [Albula goreensis]|uniref:Zyxin n=1 Tax=Albula goreensis TaxID=1534307 RepID=A0A8T3CTF6_9TELE|nr:hypothetical protein AGOR_G00207600 [Albula goreensis]
MADSSSSKPFVVTSSLSLKVTTPSFYNQPKKFASVAPPRPKSQASQPQPSAVGTAVIGRVGELPPPPPAVCEDFPPPPPPLDDAELPAPPPECQITPPASDAPPPAFPDPPPPPEEDLPLPSPPEEEPPLPCSLPTPPPPPPPPPPPIPAASNSNNAQRFLEKQTSFDRQLDSLTDMLSEMETRGPFNPKLPTQVPLVPTPKPVGPPPTAPKPALSFLPPPELQDRPPPAPWAEELKARQTNRQANQNPPLASTQPQPTHKGPSVAPKSSFSVSQSAPINSSANFGPKAGSVPAPSGNPKLMNSTTTLFAAKPAPSTSFPPPPPPVNQAPSASAAVSPAFSQSKPTPTSSHERVSPPAPSPQPKAATSPPSPQAKPMGAPVSKPSAPGPSPGGVPLSMKEVEELERMTKDFIKDMDTHAPVITSPPTEVCGKCGGALSRAQPAVRAMDKLFHSECFCCMSCQRTLQGLQFYDRDGQPQCEECYVNSLAVCSRCGERVTDRVLKALGQSFHAHCFRCSTCSCSLEGAPFITDDNNNPYCVPDYHRRFSPLCVSCNEPIVPDPGSEETVRVVALEKNFHLKCYRCEDCARPLSIEADTDGCYPLDGRILCMKCHTHRAKQAAQ